MAESSPTQPRLGGLLFGLEAADSYDAIDQLSQLLSSSLSASDAIRISAAALARESLACTCIGRETALPHARLPNMESFLVGLGLSATPIPWGPEQLPVRIVILSVVPSAANLAYLGFMKNLLQALKNEGVARQLLEAKSEVGLRDWLQRHLQIR